MLRIHSHRASAFTLALMIALTLERNTLVSIAPSISMNVNTDIEIQLGSGPIAEYGQDRT